MSNLFKKAFAGFSSIAMAASMLVMPVTAHAAAAGEVYKTTDGTVWFINSEMKRQPFTSAGAFLSYGFLSFSQVKDADSSVTALPTGEFIKPQDGRIFCATATKGTDVSGECSLITGGKKAAFTSASVFGGQGFSFSRAFYGDSSFLEKTSNIDNASAQHRPGVLINNNGTVQLVVSGGLWGVPSMDVFNSWGWSFADVVPANSADLTLTQTGVIPGRVAGQLVPTATVNDDDDDTTADCDNLDGNAGDITVTEDGTYSNEEVGEGEEEVGVLGFEVEADDDSDVAVTSVKIGIEQTDTNDSQDITDYISEVLIMYGDEVVGSADAEDFSEASDEYSKNISLDCAGVAAGETGEFSVAVSALDSLDSADIDSENFVVEVMQVRFEDADGVTTTETVGDGEQSTDTAGDVQEEANFVDFATAADVELRTSLTDDADDINDAHNEIVDEDDDTDDVAILAFTLEAAGDSDIWVDEIPVLISGSDSDLDTVISSADLYHGDTRIDSKNVTTAAASSATVTFDDLDMTIDAGDEEDFTVKVNVRGLTGNFAEGATLTASVTTASIDAEDEEGEDVAAADLTGSASAENTSLFSDGIVVTVDSAETVITTNDGPVASDPDSATFTWELTIENIGDDDVYINRDAANIVDNVATDTDDVDMGYSLSQSGTNALTSVSGTISDDGATEVTGDDTAYGANYNGEGFYEIAAGETETFTIVVTGTNSTASGQVRAYLDAIEWTTDDVTCATACNGSSQTINSYTAQLPVDSETDYEFIN